MKRMQALYIAIICISIAPMTHTNPLEELQQEIPQSGNYICNVTKCAMQSCGACCWATTVIPGVTLCCCCNDLSCGFFCGKSPCKKSIKHDDDETMVCSNTCPQYCLPNVRYGLKIALACKPSIMQ